MGRKAAYDAANNDRRGSVSDYNTELAIDKLLRIAEGKSWPLTQTEAQTIMKIILMLAMGVRK